VASLQRYRVHWSGFTGSPGVSTFYFGSPVDPAADLHTLFTAIAGHLPSQVRLDFPTSGDVITDTSGQLTGSFTSSGAAQVAGSGTNIYAPTTGAVWKWLTSTAINGRKVLGKTFIVPVDDGSLSSGTLTTATVTAMQTALTTWHATTAGGLQKVWNRPRVGVPGAQTAITGVTVSNFAAVLRSRRD